VQAQREDQKVRKATALARVALEKGDDETARSLMRDARTAQQKRDELAANIYGHRLQAETSLTTHREQNKTLLEAARIKASNEGKGSKSYQLYTRLSSIQSTIPQQATAAAARQMGISSMEGLDKDQRAQFEQLRSMYEKQMFDRAAPVINGIARELGYSDEEVAIMQGRGASKDPRIVDTPTEGVMRSR